MFRGNVDRAGTREGKKTSLRKTGKDKKVSSATNQDDGPKNRDGVVIPPLKERTVTNQDAFITFDSGANLVNRHLESDHARVIQRAIQSGVEGIAIITNDFEKSEVSLSISQAFEGVVYSVVGIHPNNISAKKMSDKLFLQLINQLRGYAIKPQVVALYGGLDYERDYGLKFPQEKFLKAQISLASELNLPVVLQDLGGGEGLLEVMKECRSNFERGMIYCFNSSTKMLEKFIELDFYISFNGLVCEVSDKGDQARDFITKVPLDRLIILTESPNLTPQTIPDEHIRKMPNEPSNLRYLIESAAKCLNMKTEELAKIVKENSMRFYGLNKPIEEPTETSTATTTTEAKEITKSKKGGDSDKPSTSTKKSAASSKKSTTKASTKAATKKKGKKAAIVESDESDSDDDDSDDDDDTEEESESEEEEEGNDQILKRLDKSELDNLYYCCKQCRTRLFKMGEIEQHEEKAKVLDHTTVSNSKKDKLSQSKKSLSCKSIFIKLGVIENCIKTDKLPVIYCQRCDAKLGSFDKMAGEQCSCGHTAKGYVRVVKNRIEIALLGEDGELVDLSLLNLSDEDDSDDDGSNLKSKKKNKVAKKNVKKSNKSNFSNYRNKNTTNQPPKKQQQTIPVASQPKFLIDDDSDDDEQSDN